MSESDRLTDFYKSLEESEESAAGAAAQDLPAQSHRARGLHRAGKSCQQPAGVRRRQLLSGPRVRPAQSRPAFLPRIGLLLSPRRRRATARSGADPGAARRRPRARAPADRSSALSMGAARPASRSSIRTIDGQLPGAERHRSLAPRPRPASRNGGDRSWSDPALVGSPDPGAAGSADGGLRSREGRARALQGRAQSGRNAGVGRSARALSGCRRRDRARSLFARRHNQDHVCAVDVRFPRLLLLLLVLQQAGHRRRSLR